jgi:hypothetical protein
MATIPDVRNTLAVIALNLRLTGRSREANQIEWCIMELHRRSYVRKARAKSAPATTGLYNQIRAYAAANPGASYMEIGQVFKVSNGRVSEALAGKRT